MCHKVVCCHEEVLWKICTRVNLHNLQVFLTSEKKNVIRRIFWMVYLKAVFIRYFINLDDTCIGLSLLSIVSTPYDRSKWFHSLMFTHPWFLSSFFFFNLLMVIDGWNLANDMQIIAIMILTSFGISRRYFIVWNMWLRSCLFVALSYVFTTFRGFLHLRTKANELLHHTSCYETVHLIICS